MIQTRTAPQAVEENLSKRLSRFYQRNLEKRADDHVMLKALFTSEQGLNDHLEQVFRTTLSRLAALGYPGVKNPEIVIRAQLDPGKVLNQDATRVHYVLPGVVDCFFAVGGCLYKGVVLSVASSCMFAGLYYFATLLAPLTGEEIFGWRMLLTLPCVTLFMLISKEWRRVVEIVTRLRRTPMLFLGLCISSALLGVQQWLFLWAPVNGRGLQVSLGYFLLPLAMLLVGRSLYRERLSTLQKVAAFSAVVGVAHELYQVGGFSWEALLVAIGFPIYFVLRRKLGTDHLGGLWFDMLLTLPFAAWIVLGQNVAADHFAQYPRLYFLVVVLAVISATAFVSYIVASRLLPFGLFGLLGYVEPVLMVAVALILGETIRTDELFTYIPIWIAVGVLIVDGVCHLRRGEAIA